MKLLYSLLTLLLCAYYVDAQDQVYVIHAEQESTNIGIATKLKHHTKVVSNTLDLYHFLENGGKNIKITNDLLDIEINGLVEKTNISPNYILRVFKGKDEKGQSIIDEYHGNIHGIKNFFGRTNDGGKFVMTVNKYGYLTLTARLTDGNIWSIHPIRNFDVQEDDYIFFNQIDIIQPEEGYLCGADNLKKVKTSDKPTISTRGTRDWYEQEMGIASDSAMWARHGSVADVNTHNSAITSSCEPDWSYSTMHDSVTTIIIEEIVSQTHADDPWEYHDVIDPNVAIDEFSNYNGFTSDPDTKKGASGNAWLNNVVGIAWRYFNGSPTTCGNLNQFMMKDLNSDTQNRNIESHERGHNMGCTHVDGNYIMKRSIGNPGYTDWKQESIDRLDSSIPMCNCFDLVLPITLVSFEGRIQNKSITLFWEVSEEYNNDYYEIEKINTSGQFGVIGTIQPENDYNSSTFYNYVDHDIIQGQNIYRLKQTDFNDDYSYSKVISVNYSSNNINKIKLYPNPASKTLDINIENKYKKLDYYIYNMIGAKMTNVKATNVNTNFIQLDISGLQNGLYYLEIKLDSRQFQKSFLKH